MGLYHGLLLASVMGEVALPQIGQYSSQLLSLDAPALSVFTDLLKTRPVTIQSTTHIDIALEHMIHTGVRLLFVVDEKDQVLGLITSYDIMGEKPLVYMQAHSEDFKSCQRTDILVKNIMQPVAEWRVLDFAALERATVADIVETFHHAGQRHVVVMESSPSKKTPVIRGLFSATQIECSIGVTFEKEKVRPSNISGSSILNDREPTLAH